MKYSHNVDKHFKRNKLAAVIVTGIVSTLVFVPSAIADEATTELDMISVVGQATSGIDRLITSDDLAKTQADDLSDVFHNDASVSVGGSVSQGQKIYVRNIGEDSLNITVDGAEQSGAVFHHAGRVFIEPELLKRVEVEAGAGSATAGPGALGGSVKFTTKDPEDLLKEDQNIGFLIKNTYFDNGEGHKTTATIYGRDSSDIVSAMMSFTGANLDELKDGNGNEIEGTESQKKLGYGKVVVNVTEDQYVSYSYEKLKEEGDILYKPELFASTRNVTEATVGERDTNIINYGFDPSGNDLIDFTINLYQTEHEQTRAFRAVSYDGSVETKGATIQNKSRISNHEITYGVNYRDDKSVLNDVDFAPNSFFEEEGKVKGIYLQDVIDVNNKLTLSAGARFDDYELNDVNGLTLEDSGVSPNLSGNYKISQNWSVSAGYAEALRGPEIRDSFRLSSYSNDATLKAEKAENTEFGIDYSTGDFSFSIGVYDSTIKDPIGGVTPFSRTVQNITDPIETTGYFLSLEKSWSKLNLSASFNSADTESGGKQVTRYVYSSSAASTGDTLALDINYEFTPSFLLGWTSEYVKGIHDINITVGTDDLVVDKPGYSTHDIYARWLPTGDDSVELNLTVKNLFDKHYLDHASVEDFTANAGYESISGSPEAGTDIRLSAAMRF